MYRLLLGLLICPLLVKSWNAHSYWNNKYSSQGISYSSGKLVVLLICAQSIRILSYYAVHSLLYCLKKPYSKGIFFEFCQVALYKILV